MTTEAPTTPLLDDQLCADLVAASRAIVTAYDATLGRLGVDYPQYLALLVLWEAGGPVGISDLADRLRLPVEQVQPTVRSMVVARTATRVADAADPAGWVVAPGPRAEDLRAAVTEVHCDIKARLGMGALEFRELQQTLRAITRAMS
ncbi:MarR family winged helix-turn-helix transcriptional regulator [Nocardioides zeae]|uniref:Winged helix-turn-helix transcriptional regulator n=1 Tax=Nocardioides zeae TaxID=1457234 RepID=A0A6P0HKK5_9ACTN|nr:MarR family winged helix-turn-helix transcriptional regulator [Nocardioides zeae]NEN79212.1 winged helix-turn-helix transcriptional regulator [Nocardioides zeae]